MPTINKFLAPHLMSLTLVLLLRSAGPIGGNVTKISFILWTLVIVSSCLVTALKALGCLATYSLFVSPTHSPNTDDCIHYVT